MARTLENFCAYWGISRATERIRIPRAEQRKVCVGVNGPVVPLFYVRLACSVEKEEKTQVAQLVVLANESWSCGKSGVE